MLTQVIGNATFKWMADAKKVLIIEDDFFIRDLYQAEAENQGLEADVAVDGKQALEKIGQNKPDIILLDLMLPNMDGLTVLKTVKAGDTTRDIPVVVITNVEDSEKERQALSSGASAYLLKINNTPGSIVTKVKEMLGKA